MKSRTKVQAKDSGWLWRAEVNTRLRFLVHLDFRGVRLGSWFDPHGWSEAIVQSPPAVPSCVAAMLRAWKANFAR